VSKAALAAALAALVTALFAQTRPDGQETFGKRCGGCHTLDRDQEGPRLGGVYGRKAGTVRGFPYSDALKKSGIRWTDKTLDLWLAGPERQAPGTDMQFQVDKEEERAAIIAYLKER